MDKKIAAWQLFFYPHQPAPPGWRLGIIRPWAGTAQMAVFIVLHSKTIKNSRPKKNSY